MITLRMLGALELRMPTETESRTVLAQPKRLALLAYLSAASPVGFHRRDTLLGLLWPDLDQDHARSALSQAIYYLRRSLGREVVLSRGNEEVAIDPDRLWCDVVGFRMALSAGAAREALELYRGDLLPGFFLSNAPEFERWLEEERAELRRRAAAAAWGLAETAGSAGDPADAAIWGRRAVTLTPGDEAQLRQLITLLDRMGNRAAAVEAYEQFAERFARDYEIDPSPETQALIGAVRAREEPNPDGSAAPEGSASARTAGSFPTPVSVGAPTTALGPESNPRLPDGAADRPPQRPWKRRRVLLGVLTTLIAALVISASILLSQKQGAGAPHSAGEAISPTNSQVAEALPLEARARDPDQLATRGTSSDEAYSQYLKGRYFLGKLDEDSFRQARDHFQQALDLDPTFAGAWGGLADAYVQLASVSGLHAGEAYPRARAAAEQALKLDRGLADAHASLATAFSMYYWDSGRAEGHFKRAIELDPSYAMARRMYASHLRNLGRFDEALDEVRKAQELDPLSSFPRLEEGIILYVAREYDAAIAQCRRLLAAVPASTHASVLLALAYAQKGQYTEALAALPDDDPTRVQPDAHAVRGYIHALSGERDAALRTLQSLDSPAGGQPVSAFHAVPIYIGLGQHDRALDALEEAAEERSGLIRLLNVEPIFDPLRSHPRFQSLLKKVGLQG